MGMGAMFVRGISEIAELRVSLRRLQAFLMNDEFIPSIEYLSNGTGKLQEATKDAVRMDNFSAKWNRNNSDLALENLNISIPRGSLFGVIGPVGSGKSSLLQAILGMEITYYLCHISTKKFIQTKIFTRNVMISAPTRLYLAILAFQYNRTSLIIEGPTASRLY